MREKVDPLDAALDELFGAPGSGETEVAPDTMYQDSKLIVWDVETGPQSKAALGKYYAPPEAPGDFDPSTVKVGNLGPEKAEAKIDKARDEHDRKLAEFEQVEIDCYEAFVDMSPLNPVTGRILTSQYLFADEGDAVLVDQTGWQANTEEQETGVLERLWERVDHVRSAGGRIYGYNINQFDLPFAIQRSYRLGVTVPKGLFWKNRYPADFFVDLYDVWRCGRNQKFTDVCGYRLVEVAEFLGLDLTKTMDGGEFWKNYRYAKTRAKAIEYAETDVRIEAELARRLGVL